MKKEYTPAELEIILFYQDVITTSMNPDFDEKEDGGIGGGYNPGSWT